MTNIIIMDETKTNISFHFNKAHLINSEIPMWVIKHKGITYYVHHLDVSPGVGFSTKETPDNEKTKGSIKFKGKLLIKNFGDKIIAEIS